MEMKQMKQWLMVAAVVALCGMMTGCKGNAQRPVNGTFEGLIGKGTPPEAVLDATKKLAVTDHQEVGGDRRAPGNGDGRQG